MISFMAALTVAVVFAPGIMRAAQNRGTVTPEYVEPYSIDLGRLASPGTTLTSESSPKPSVFTVDGSYEGKLGADVFSILGMGQGSKTLSLDLVTPSGETAQTVSDPSSSALAPMTVDANHSFEVATIRPSNPESRDKAIMVRGRHFSTLNTSLSNLIAFAYGLNPQQILKGPAWVESDKYDIEAVPDGQGTTSSEQWKTMIAKLLADRFQLKFHRETKELSVYALLVAKRGPKLKESAGDPKGLPVLAFRSLGDMLVRNATMTDFAGVMQGSVLDRPVVDQTGLEGRFDFELKWAADESQFGGLGVRLPPPGNNPDAAPGLFTAIQQELGLRFDSTKASVGVFVIDQVERPSPN
jgi:uncharacterized protein (TIGR03435 family)